MKILRIYKEQKKALGDEDLVNSELKNSKEFLRVWNSKDGGLGFDDKNNTITCLPHYDSKGNEKRNKMKFDTKEEYEKEKKNLKENAKSEVKKFKSYNKSLEMAKNGHVRLAALRETIKTRNKN